MIRISDLETDFCCICDKPSIDTRRISLSSLDGHRIEVISLCEKHMRQLKDTLDLLFFEEERKPPCESAKHDSDGCLGFSKSPFDDEPIAFCLNCKYYSGNFIKDGGQK